MKNTTKPQRLVLASALCTALLPCFLFVKTALAADRLFISQVQITGGAGRTGEDFVEIFNPNNAAVNLKGYRLVKKPASATGTEASIKSWTSDSYIQPFGFYLWANSDFTAITATPDTLTTATLAGDNGTAIRFGAPETGELVDGISWGNADNGFKNISPANPEAGQSLWRQDLYGADSGFAIAAGQPRNSASPVMPLAGSAASTTPETSTTTPQSGNGENTDSPTGTPSYGGVAEIAAVTKSADIRISEILANPQGEDSGCEQAELENTGNQAVSLEGWYLGDKSETGVKPSAYKIGSVTVQPGAFAVITIPKGSFSLNNSGGDVLNLYFADKGLADSVSYQDAAPEELTYQKQSGAWLWGNPSLGSRNALQEGQMGPDEGAKDVVISEFLPDVQGADEGQEWVELYNKGSKTISLKGYLLDDEGSGDLPGSSALALDGNHSIKPGEFLVVAIPEDKFTLDNSGSDELRLFAPSGKLLEKAWYEKAEEGKSFSRDQDGRWQVTIPTPGQKNATDLPDYQVAISEILPNPSADQDEFVELVNLGKEEVSLKGMSLHLGSKPKLIENDTFLKSGEYHVIYEDDLPVRLRNTGLEIRLTDFLGRELSAAQYGKAQAGLSFARTGEKSYSWTASVTPGKANEVVLGVAEENKEEAPLGSAAKASGKTETKAYNALLKANESLEEKVAELENKIDDLSQMISENLSIPELAQAEAFEPAENYAVSSEKVGKYYLAIAVLCLVILALVIKLSLPINAKGGGGAAK